jgi:uncharacterized protein (TIGR02118 family)
MTIYRSALINRKDDISAEEYKKHWIEVHGYLASKLPGLGTYRQNHILERFFENIEPPLQAIDGISQLSFESVEAMQISDASPEYAAVKADIPNFQGAITILVLDSREVLSDTGADEVTVKLLWVSTSRGGIGDEEMRKRWMEGAAELAPKVSGLRRCVQNFVVDRGHPVHAGVATGDAGPVEALTEMWFDSRGELVRALESKWTHQLMHENPDLRVMAAYRIEEIHIRR